MITKLPNQSTLSSGPLWLCERPSSLKTIHRSDYKGHYHSTKIPGPQCLIAKNKKFKVSAYLSTLPLSPPENPRAGSAGKTWLADSFESREVKWRRNDNLHPSTDAFDAPSNYRLQFTQKPLESRVQYVAKHIPIKTMEKFDSISTYNTDYRNMMKNRDDLCYVLQKREPVDILTWSKDSIDVKQPFYQRKELPPLDSNTSYRTQYPTWSITPRNQYKRLNETEKRITYDPFDGETSYQAHYNLNASTDRLPNERINSSSGFLSREQSINQLTLVPYLEYQKPVFYTVKNEN